MSRRILNPDGGQRRGLGLAALLVATLAGACGPDIQVRTAASPEAFTLAGRRTFSVSEASKSEIIETSANGHANGNGNGNANGNGNGNAVSYGISDPMIDNSITERAVHDQIKAAFEARGYRYTTKNPEFEIRYKATLAPILDVRTYNTAAYGGYGYYGYGYDGYCCGAGTGAGYAVATYDRGTVIIDAVDPKSDKLLWRGQGTAGAYSDPKSYLKELRHAVRAVAKKFPANHSPIPYTASR